MTRPTADGGNRHPIDRIADIRREMAELEAEHAALRDRVLAGEIGREGDEYRATLQRQERRSIDARRARAVLPPELLAEVERASSVTVLRLWPLGGHRHGQAAPDAAGEPA